MTGSGLDRAYLGKRESDHRTSEQLPLADGSPYFAVRRQVAFRRQMHPVPDKRASFFGADTGKKRQHEIGMQARLFTRLHNCLRLRERHCLTRAAWPPLRYVNQLGNVAQYLIASLRMLN